MSDAPASLPLDDGERVLRRGRVAVGAPWPSFGRLALVALGCWTALVVALVLALVLAVGEPVGPRGVLEVAFGAGVLVGLPTIVVAVSKLVGPCYVSILCLLVTGPAFVSGWLTQVEQHGWKAALERRGHEDYLVALLFVGVPALVIVATLLDRLDATCVITDRRLVQLDGNGKVVAQRAYTVGGFDDLRLVRTWRHPAGLLCAGFDGPWIESRLALALRDDDPARVLQDVRRERRRS